MTTPLVPNFNGTGHLVTDRFDFAKHTDGYSFKHNADKIVLSPSITVGISTFTNVQDAINALTLTGAYSLAPATSSILGGVKLLNDLAGGGGSTDGQFPKVVGIQGRSITSTMPTIGQILTYNGSAWAPADDGYKFSANGDLAGTNIVQTVIGLAGDIDGYITITGNSLKFDQAVNSPLIKQNIKSGSSGQNLTIQAQSTSTSGLNGGNLIVSGGASGGGSGLNGGVKLQLNTGNIAEVTQVIQSQRVFSLFANTSGAALTSTQMDTGSGDMVMFIGNANTVPTVSSPDGTILYSSAGKLYVMQSDDQQFPIGSIPNPSIWGDTGQQTYTRKSYVKTIGAPTLGNAMSPAIDFSLYTNSSIRIDVMFVGKKIGTTDTAQFNMSVGYVTDAAGNPTIIGTLTNSDPRTNGSASGWTIPNISVSSKILEITTGGFAATNIWWLTVMQLSIVQDS